MHVPKFILEIAIYSVYQLRMYIEYSPFDAVSMHPIKIHIQTSEHRSIRIYL